MDERAPLASDAVDIAEKTIDELNQKLSDEHIGSFKTREIVRRLVDQLTQTRDALLQQVAQETPTPFPTDEGTDELPGAVIRRKEVK